MARCRSGLSLVLTPSVPRATVTPRANIVGMGVRPVPSFRLLPGSLNLEQFVAGRRWWPWAREGLEAAGVFAGDAPCTGEDRHRVSTKFDALQNGRLREARLLSPPRLRTGRESFP